MCLGAGVESHSRWGQVYSRCTPHVPTSPIGGSSHLGEANLLDKSAFQRDTFLSYNMRIITTDLWDWMVGRLNVLWLEVDIALWGHRHSLSLFWHWLFTRHMAV